MKWERKAGARKGQAFVELAMGMFALALVLSALFAFTNYILASLDIQRTLRADAGKRAMTSGGFDDAYVSMSASDTITVEPFAAEYMFGSEQVQIKEEVHMPVMGGIFQ